MKVRAKNLFFVLVEPQSPGNVGAAARALKTMGFTNLLLVNPCDPLAPEARMMAHASHSILENARRYPSLPEALEGMNFVVAATQRKREFNYPFFTPAELSEKIVSITQEHKVAIVFGREKNGLSNAELACCHAITTIPAWVKHPSLNLAQAVMLYCYEFFQRSFNDEKKYHWRLAEYREIEKLFEHVEASLKKVNFKPRAGWSDFMMRFRRVLGRSNLEKRDVRMLHKVFQAFDEQIRILESRQASSKKGE